MKWPAYHQTGEWFAKCDYIPKNPTAIGQGHCSMNTNCTNWNDYDSNSVQFDNLWWEYWYERMTLDILSYSLYEVN